MENTELIKYAAEAEKNAYAPYSNFSVGAALLGKNGKVYTGCNIENSSYGASNCAERTALFKAVSEGEREFDKIAIVSSSGDYTYPCGICRQVLSEFMPDGTVVLFSESDGIKEFKVSALLPEAFRL
ncbi:cytidine deaminase [Lachnospiraceae bacterium NSJ-143]|nr:cytidine deaminase [Lachnospiraceae bacterium NSJ-143]